MSLETPEKIRSLCAAGFAAMRLDQLSGLDQPTGSRRAELTPRELSVLRHLSMGDSFKEVAQALELGEETIRTHLKKVQAKLGVRNRTHAVAEALRQRLIP
jgi:DNA-binding CsgD family transcriptional regulator